MKPLLGLRDVARAAGVHFTTVSLALRNDPRISIGTRERIQQLAAKMGYHSNPLVSSLISSLKRAKLPSEIGVIGFLDTLSRPAGPFRRSPVGHPFYEGAVKRGEELGYRIDLFQLHQSGMTFKRMNGILAARGIRGLIIDSNSYPSGHLSLDISELTCVLRGYSSLRPNLTRVSHNHYQGISAAIHAVRHLGYRRIGLAVNHNVDRLVNNQWTAGFLAFQMHSSVRDRIPPLLTAEQPLEEMKTWLRRYRPDLVLGISSAFDILTRVGVKIPDELGFVNLDLDTTLDTKQAGVWQHMRELGATAIETVTAQMQRNERGAPKTPNLILLEGVWRQGWTAVARSRPPTENPMKPRLTKKRSLLAT